MKISAFANLYKMTPETVRYYVNEGLLIPHSKNNRYDFDEDDRRDMDFLLQLKSYHFSNHEIQRILALRRLSNFDSPDELNDYITLLKKQKQKLTAEQEKLHQAVEDIETELTSLSKRNIGHSVQRGIPFPFLRLLACPHCQHSLSLENCHIENQEILSGTLHCCCGYQAEIKNGIIVGQTGTISQYDGIDTERNCYRMMSPELLGLVQKAYMWLDERLTACDTSHHVILEDCINNYCFCYTNLVNLNPNAFYIISDKYKEVVEMYKNLIEKLGLQHNILYIAAGNHLLPLRYGCVDYYIDFDSSNEYAILYQSFAPVRVEEYLSSQAKYLGAFFHFSYGSDSIKELHYQYPESWKWSFDSSHFKACLTEEWQHVEYDEAFGYVIDSGYGESFTYHVGKEKLWLSPYFCREKKH